MNQNDIEDFFKQLECVNPIPQTELECANTFTLLIAVVLSAQATDKSVNKATQELFKIVSTPEEMVKLGEEKLKDFIRPVGLYNAKAKNIIALSKILIERFAGRIPETLDELISLPGVGRKTANVILNVAFKQVTIAVDTHVFRVANRTGLAPGKTPLLVEKKLLTVVPSAYRLHAHHWLILHGRYICKAQKPLCEQCPVQSYCNYYQALKLTFAKNTVNDL